MLSVLTEEKNGFLLSNKMTWKRARTRVAEALGTRLGSEVVQIHTTHAHGGTLAGNSYN